MSGVTQVAAGSNHSLFLKEDGSLYAMGNNRFGQLGLAYGGSHKDGVNGVDGLNRPREIAISPSGNHACYRLRGRYSQLV